jgi:hypothetical protein
MYSRVRVDIPKKDTLGTSSTYSCNKQCHSLYSHYKCDIEHPLRLTDSFTWDELLTRDPDISYLTKVGCIPNIQTLRYITGLITFFHIIQNISHSYHPRNYLNFVVSIGYIGDSSLCVCEHKIATLNTVSTVRISQMLVFQSIRKLKGL